VSEHDAPGLGWLVLAGVFLAELVALAALFVWGLSAQGWVLAVAVTLAAAVAWGLFAAPKARFPHPVGRAVVKAVVFAGAVAGLWAAGHPGWAVAVGAFVVLVHVLARFPAVRAVDPRGL
jgi:4-amino-4-deoxy-L-arabinose transferase-like glycosyltransferase